MEKALSLEFLRVVERAAIASAHTMGLGDRHKSDQVAVEAMRSEMDHVGMDGTIVIGEGRARRSADAFHRRKGRRRGKGQDPANIPKSSSPSTRSKAPTSAPPANRTPSSCSPPANPADCYTRPTFTWRKSSSARPAKAPWIWTRPSLTICTRSPSASTAKSKTSSSSFSIARATKS